jgi:hypothetical protein
VNNTLGFPHRAQHDALRRLRQALDDAITAPSLDSDRWVSDLRGVLMRLSRIFGKHIEETEAANGSLAEIVELKPYLMRQVQKIKDEHVELKGRIEQLAATTERACLVQGVPVESLRTEAGHLADAIRLHQAKGIDLVYEAYNRVDGFS